LSQALAGSSVIGRIRARAAPWLRRVSAPYRRSRAAGAPDDGIPDIHYSLVMEAESYQKALEYLGNIAHTCQGVITLTMIEKIEAS